MIVDRVKNPDYQTIQQVNIPKIESILLSNGIPLHYISVGEQPVVKLEISFDAGNWYEKENGVSFFTAKMLGEGTAKYSSSQISAFFDQFGAFIEFGHGLDRANITVYGLAKYLPELLPMVQEVLNNATFPEDELLKFKKIQLQTLAVNAEKTSFLANKIFRNTIFGDNHTYGISLDEKAINAISRASLVEFYQSFWLNRKPRIFLSGKITATEVKLVEDFFGDIKVQEGDKRQLSNEQLPEKKKILIEREESIQSSIRIGKQMMTRKHPDYFKMLVLNETLGGYFGSRLMKNIREEKGLTYGISSNIAPFTQAGYFVIGTDVKKEYTQLTIDEIYKEITILQKELIDADELEVVKNYMIGSFAGSLNTPFDISDRYKVIFSEDLPADFYDCYIQNIQAVNAEMVMEVANQHLSINSLDEIVVGGK